MSGPSRAQARQGLRGEAVPLHELRLVSQLPDKFASFVSIALVGGPKAEPTMNKRRHKTQKVGMEKVPKPQSEGETNATPGAMRDTGDTVAPPGESESERVVWLRDVEGRIFAPDGGTGGTEEGDEQKGLREKVDRRRAKSPAPRPRM